MTAAERLSIQFCLKCIGLPGQGGGSKQMLQAGTVQCAGV